MILYFVVQEVSDLVSKVIQTFSVLAKRKVIFRPEKKTNNFNKN